MGRELRREPEHPQFVVDLYEGKRMLLEPPLPWEDLPDS